MGRFTQGQRLTGWHGAWALVLALVMAALYYGTDVVQSLDRHLYDAASSDARHMYRWTKSWWLPWMRPVWGMGPGLAARYFGTTGRPAVLCGAKTIVLATPLDAPQSNLAQPFVAENPWFVAYRTARGSGSEEQVGRALDEADAALDADARLAISLRNAGNVLLPTQLLAPSGAAAGDAPLPSYVHRSALPDLGAGFVLPASAGAQPLALFGQAAAGIGHMQTGPGGWMASFARHPCSWVSMAQRFLPWRC